VEFRKSEKSAKILKISGFWHFFRFQNSTFKYLYKPCKVCQLFLFFCPLLCRSMWPPWQEKWRDFAWPAKVLKSGIFLDLKKITRILQSLRFCHLLQIFKIPLLNTLKANQSVSIFWTRIFFLFTSGKLGIIIPLERLPSLEPKHETYTHTHTHRS
jgi:hypothetical protein